MKNFWIAIAVLTAALCGFLGYKIANRKPMNYAVAASGRPGAKEVGDVIEAARNDHLDRPSVEPGRRAPFPRIVEQDQHRHCLAPTRCAS